MTDSALIQRTGFLIGGEWVESEGNRYVDAVSPFTEEIIGRSPLATGADVDRAVTAARAAFDNGPWPRMSIDERRTVLLAIADRFEENAESLDRLAVSENGTLLRNHPGAVAAAIRYYANLEIPPPEFRIAPNGDTAEIVHEPVGVVAAIVPWNNPIALMVGKVVPALLAGCTVVLKPSPETPLTVYPTAELFAAGGLPPGALNFVIADREISEVLVRDRRIDMVSFTGSTAAGKKIGAICGDRLARVALELGGKSPVILLDDVDLETAAPAVLAGGMLLNNGEACCAWTRILVPRGRHDEIVDAFCEVARGVRMGDPSDLCTELGPLVTRTHRERVEAYIASALDDGASLAVGGRRPEVPSKGWFVEPTIIVDATNDMRSSREEIFGPVVSVIPYDDDEDALRIANETNYGLSSGIFSNDHDRARAMARGIRAGTVGINTIGTNIAFPFGGFKESGIGRQHGPESVAEFLEVKTVALPKGSREDRGSRE